MNKQIQVKHLLIFGVIILFLVYFFGGSENPKDTVKKTTKTEVEVKENKDSARVDDLLNKKQKKVKAVVNKKTNKTRQKKETDTITENEKVVDAFKLIDTVNFKNGKLRATILSEGKILSTDYQFTTFDSIIKTTEKIETTKYRTPNALFLNYQRNMDFSNNSFIGQELSADYTIRGKFRIGAGVGQLNLPGGNKTTYWSLKLGIKIK